MAPAPAQKSRRNKRGSKLTAAFSKFVSGRLSGRSKGESAVPAAAPAALPSQPAEESIVQEPVSEAAETAAILGKAGTELATKIRQDDYIGTLADGNLYILLSNSNNDDADFVVRRIESAGYQCALMEDFGV